MDDQNWHGGSKPLTLDEAKVSIALTAVSGGLFEDGDDLPTLGETPERVALLENRDLLDMARLGRASTPLDLLNYRAEDLQPSIFFTKEDPRQSILTVFNWTESSRSHHITLSDLGLAPGSNYIMTDVLDSKPVAHAIAGSLNLTLAPHSVRMLKIVNKAVASHSPVATVSSPSSGSAGETLHFAAEPATPSDAIVHYRWDFGDGVVADGSKAAHTYTHDGTFHVALIVTGLNGVVGRSSSSLTITGAVSTRFHPEEQRRLESNPQ